MSRTCVVLSSVVLGWILLGYALGSVPFAFLLARRAGIDVRIAGSGNVGAANVLRTSGGSLGVTVMALDITKGAARVCAAYVGAGTPSARAGGGAGALCRRGVRVNLWSFLSGLAPVSRRKGCGSRRGCVQPPRPNRHGCRCPG